MMIEPLPSTWPSTRTALQAYAQALTAFPRAGAPHDARWGHVAMQLVLEGLRSAPTPLDDGTTLESELDLHLHRIVITAGDDTIIFDLGDQPTPEEVGRAIADLVAAHGTTLDVDASRYAVTDVPPYDPAAAAAFLANAKNVFMAMEFVNERLDGEIAGPHLWPHGFDIATEWYSDKLVPLGDGEASAQIAFGWYPGADGSYVYVNPWPYEDAFGDIALADDVTWNLEGWQGAKLDVPSGGIEAKDAAELAIAIHEGAGPSLRA